MFPSDKKGKIVHPKYLFNGFRIIVNECDLYELFFRGGKYTWEQGRGTHAWVREKLDRGFATSS